MQAGALRKPFSFRPEKNRSDSEGQCVRKSRKLTLYGASCVAFSPELNEFAGQHKDDFVVVLVPRDHREDAFEEYSSHKDHFLR